VPFVFFVSVVSTLAIFQAEYPKKYPYYRENSSVMV